MILFMKHKYTMYLVHYCLVSLNHHQVHTAIMKIKRILTTQLGSLYLKKYVMDTFGGKIYLHNRVVTDIEETNRSQLKIIPLHQFVVTKFTGLISFSNKFSHSRWVPERMLCRIGLKWLKSMEDTRRMLQLVVISISDLSKQTLCKASLMKLQLS